MPVWLRCLGGFGAWVASVSGGFLVISGFRASAPGGFGAWEWRVTPANGIFNKIHHDIGTHVVHHLFPQVKLGPVCCLRRENKGGTGRGVASLLGQ